MSRLEIPAALARAVRAGPVVILLAASGCYGEVDTDPAYYPPPAYVATVNPVFYDGHAVYWYGGHWAYREPDGRWNYYRREPGFLAQHHAIAAPPRHVYERRAAPRHRL